MAYFCQQQYLSRLHGTMYIVVEICCITNQHVSCSTRLFTAGSIILNVCSKTLQILFLVCACFCFWVHCLTMISNLAFDSGTNHTKNYKLIEKKKICQRKKYYNVDK